MYNLLAKQKIIDYCLKDIVFCFEYNVYGVLYIGESGLLLYKKIHEHILCIKSPTAPSISQA